jgi:hypothetical protein
MPSKMLVGGAPEESSQRPPFVMGFVTVTRRAPRKVGVRETRKKEAC